MLASGWGKEGWLGWLVGWLVGWEKEGGKGERLWE